MQHILDTVIELDLEVRISRASADMDGPIKLEFYRANNFLFVCDSIERAQDWLSGYYSGYFKGE